MPKFTEAEQSLIRARRYYFTGKLEPQEPVICNGYPGKVIKLYADGPYEAARMYEVRLASGPVCVCGSDLVPEDFDLKLAPRPKFEALSARDLRTPERNAGRVARKVAVVVTVEADDGSWFELDATDQGHAGAMAVDQVDKMKARGASCWHVESDGKLARSAFYTYYWNGDE